MVVQVIINILVVELYGLEPQISSLYGVFQTHIVWCIDSLWWGYVDSNHRPRHYQWRALTSWAIAPPQEVNCSSDWLAALKAATISDALSPAELIAHQLEFNYFSMCSLRFHALTSSALHRSYLHSRCCRAVTCRANRRTLCLADHWLLWPG